tara:strand:+ start:1387 stop:2667 length:1281 start_codon:yes stop_codon:yes gene_type:complete
MIKRNFLEKHINIILNISLISSSIYFCIRLLDCFYFIDFPIGDEPIFVNDFKYFLNHGFFNSIINGTSIPFTLLSVFIHKITGLGDISTRIAGTLSSILLIYYFYTRLSFVNTSEKKYFFTMLLFLLPTSGASIAATNDSMFFLFLIMFIYETFIFKDNSKSNYILKIISISIVIMTRKVSLVYISVIIFGFIIFLLINKKVFLKESLSIFKTLFLGLVIAILFSVPRFVENDYSLSYADKSIYKKRGITWTEWVFHSQLIGNENNRFGLFSLMVDWKEALKYKNINGDESLPDTYFEYLFFDSSFLLKRFISSLIEISIISLRYVGILLYLLPIFIKMKLRNMEFDKSLLASIYTTIGILCWAFIWPGLVQHRWLFPFYVLLIYSFSTNLRFFKKKLKFLLVCNLLIINIIIIWVFWKENFFYGI